MALRLRWEPWASRLLDGCFLFAGCWTLLCWTVAFLGASFQTLLALSWLPCVAAMALLLVPGAAGTGAAGRFDSAADEPLEPATLAIAATLAALVVVIYRATVEYALFWALAVTLLYAAQRRARRDPPPPATDSETPHRATAGSSNRPALFLLALCAVAVAVTLAAHRPDGDDSFYVNLVVTSLDHPTAPLLGHDGLYGEPNLPTLEPWYILKSYEPFVATISRLTGCDPKTLYYLVFPALFAILMVAATEAALRDLGGGAGPAVLGSAIVVLVLIAWGDVHQAFGNFGFVRLYQGKAVVVSVCVPAIVHYASRFARTRDLRAWLLLGLAQVAALGISGSAIVAVPVTALAFLAGSFLATRRTAAIFHGLGAASLALAFAAVVFARMPFERGLALSWAELSRLPSDTASGLAAVLGSGLRRSIALFALLLAPQLAPPSRRRIVIGYVLVLLLVVMNPLVPPFAARMAHRFLWRILWAVPFPLLLGLCGQRIAVLRFARWGAWPGTALAGALAAVFAAVPGTSTLSPLDGTRLALPSAKVPPEHALAGSLVARTATQDLVLAPFAIAQWVPTYRHHPRLVGVRWQYFAPVESEGPEKVEERQRLQALVGAAPLRSAAAVAEGVSLVACRGVDVVVLDSLLAWRAPLAAGLLQLGCIPSAEPLSVRYELWRCPRSRQGA
jgi:hypothetical protein